MRIQLERESPRQMIEDIEAQITDLKAVIKDLAERFEKIEQVLLKKEKDYHEAEIDMWQNKLDAL